jgi:putative ABC transport system substrate-binding protein
MVEVESCKRGPERGDAMRRRGFIKVIGGAAAWPLAALAQQVSPVRWIGVLFVTPDGDPLAREYAAVFEQGLGLLGWTVGRNLAIDYRWGVNDSEKARAAVGQILRLAPSVILTNGGPALMAAQQATRTVPIVFTGISEPVERGFVASFAHPGGNTTGFTNFEATIGGKWLDLFREAVPRVSVMFNPASSFSTLFFRTVEGAAKKGAVDVVAAHVSDLAEIGAAITALAHEPNTGLMLPPDGFTPAYRRQILELTARYRLPAISWIKSFAAEGGLMSYGIDPLEPYRRAAGYIDRILKGEKPADLPVQAPVKYELAVNVKTAKALGLDLPASVLARVDEVIE